MIPVFPVRTLTVLSAVEFLCCFSSYQLKTLRNNFFVSIFHQQMDMIRSDKEKLLFMATMCNMPNLSWNMMPIGSGYPGFP